MDVGVVIALIAGFGGLGAGAVALFTMGAQRRKISAEGSKAMAEAMQIITTSATNLLGPAEKKAEQLEKQLVQTKARMESAEAEVAELRTTVATANARADHLASQLSEAERRADSLNDRLKLAQQLLTELNIPFPPLQDG